MVTRYFTTSSWNLSRAATRLNYYRQLDNNNINNNLNCTKKSYICRRFVMTGASPENLIEWLIIIPDQPEKLDKRMAVRTKHIEALGEGHKEGFWQMGGAYLKDLPSNKDGGSLKIQGSAMIARASSREEVLKRLKEDIYAQENIWDFEKVQIYPFKCAFRTVL
ncbi:putative ycii-related domain protein [Erysiphe neolycopersici]|uniref:Putative ycii-related domain protein n=1 Tax=Erysiphe neolycopersici TaxID=212602 RepID=A0A420HXE0_9PEZI|nr:putative ycii-related domain protein [Erysiphe neolycopersici]